MPGSDFASQTIHQRGVGGGGLERKKESAFDRCNCFFVFVVCLIFFVLFLFLFLFRFFFFPSLVSVAGSSISFRVERTDKQRRGSCFGCVVLCCCCVPSSPGSKASHTTLQLSGERVLWKNRFGALRHKAKRRKKKRRRKEEGEGEQEEKEEQE